MHLETQELARLRLRQEGHRVDEDVRFSRALVAGGALGPARVDEANPFARAVVEAWPRVASVAPRIVRARASGIDAGDLRAPERRRRGDNDEEPHSSTHAPNTMRRLGVSRGRGSNG